MTTSESLFCGSIFPTNKDIKRGSEYKKFNSHSHTLPLF